MTIDSKRSRRLSASHRSYRATQRTSRDLNRQRTRAQKFRENYDPQDWGTYLFAVHATVIPQIFLRLLGFTFWAGAVVACHFFFYEFPQVTTLPHTVAGSALALLIVFRTNQAHSRFWEGRDLFGSLFANCVDAARQALLWVGGNSVHRSRIAHLLTAYPYSVMNHVRGQDDTAEIEALWDDAQFHALMDAEDLPNVLIMAVSHELVAARKQGLMLDAAATRLDASLSELMRLRAAIEKISFTPIPHAYAIEGSRMILFFLSSLPFVLVPTLGWLTVPTIFLLTFEYLGIEEIGAEIEDPFGFDFNDLPLDKMCEVHRYNLIEISEFRARYHAKSKSPLPFHAGLQRDGSTSSNITYEGALGRAQNGERVSTVGFAKSGSYTNFDDPTAEGGASPPPIANAARRGNTARNYAVQGEEGQRLGVHNPIAQARSTPHLGRASDVSRRALGETEFDDPHRPHAPF